MKTLFFVCIHLIAITFLHAKALSPAVELSVNEGFSNLIGFYDDQPVLSWKLPKGVQKQTAYAIRVSSNINDLENNPDLWKTGKVLSEQSLGVLYQGKPLRSRDRAYWQVKYWDENGKPSDWSAPSFFELGLLSNTDWKAKWVYLDEPFAKGKRQFEIKILDAKYGLRDSPNSLTNVKEFIQERASNGLFEICPDQDIPMAEQSKNRKNYNLWLLYEVGNIKVKQVIPGDSTYNLKTRIIKEGKKNKKSKLNGIVYRPQYFRKEFLVPQKIKQARIYLTAKGMYEAFINGQRVSSDLFTPGYTPYKNRIETLSYDVTDFIIDGQNALAATLGEGWYAGRLLRKKYLYPEAQPMLLIQLEVTLDSGEIITIATDQTWKVTNKGPLVYSEIYDGESYDARLEIPGWKAIGFDDQDWSTVTTKQVVEKPHLTPKRHSTSQVTQILQPINITEPSPGRFIFDLGQNFVGLPKLHIPVEKDKKVTIRFGEMLNQNGTLYTENYRSAQSVNYFIPAKSETITWQPTFTFHGYRYLELSGLPVGVIPDKNWVEGLVVHSVFDHSGNFHSSHQKVNQLQKNITWGQRGNYLDIPTDCPQRDERLGWTGDAQVFCATGFFNYDVHAFWASWLQSCREEQLPNGYVTHTVPNDFGGAGSPGWGDVAVVSPWDIYVRTGDRRILQDNYEMMERWVDAYVKESPGYICKRKVGWGDWLQPFAKSQKSDTPRSLIATAYFGRCTYLMEKISLVLDKPEEAKHYSSLFENVRSAFQNKFFNEEGKLITPIETQTAYLLALAFNLLSEEQVDGAVDHLVRLIGEADGHLRTGFLGTPLLNPVLTKYGKSDLAYQILFKETYPGWFYSINQGATTMWERWNSYSHDNGFGNARMNSFNHYAYGAIGQWMYETIAGLRPDPQQPGYKHFFINPLPNERLEHASAELETPYGLAKSAWVYEEDTLKVMATIPPNTTATFIVPPSYRLHSGKANTGDSITITASSESISLSPGEYQLTLSQE